MDRLTKSYERVEPHGFETIPESKDIIFDQFPWERIDQIFAHGYYYITSGEICPQELGPQSKQEQEEGAGYCIVWVTLYLHMRLLHPKIKYAKDIMQTILELDPGELLDYIKRYQSYIDTIIPDEAIIGITC